MQLGLGEQFLQGAFGIEAATSMAELAGQELEIGGKNVDPAHRLAQVGDGPMVDRGAQIFQDGVDLRDSRVEPGGGGGNLSIPDLRAA